MTTISQRKKELLDELKDKEYRDEYVSSSIDVGLAFQIRALREQRGWIQTRFAKEAGMQQARISVLENPSHSPTLDTLKKLAAAFDVGLVVKFVPISEVVKRELNLANESLTVPSYDDDPYFKEQAAPKDAGALWSGKLLGGDVERHVRMQQSITPNTITVVSSSALAYNQQVQKPAIPMGAL